MKKEDREKLQNFIRAELALGGTLTTDGYRRSQTLQTVDEVSVDLSAFRQAVNELVQSGAVIRRACHSDYTLAPKEPRDVKYRATRKVVYTYSRAHMAYRTNGKYTPVGPEVTALLHIVTPWGTFGNCATGKTFATFDEAKAALLRTVTEAANEARKDYEAVSREIERETEMAKKIAKARKERE